MPSTFSGVLLYGYFGVSTKGHGNPFFCFEKVLGVGFGWFNFHEHISAIIFESQGCNFGRVDLDSTTRLDGIQEQFTDGDSHDN